MNPGVVMSSCYPILYSSI